MRKRGGGCRCVALTCPKASVSRPCKWTSTSSSSWSPPWWAARANKRRGEGINVRKERSTTSPPPRLPLHFFFFFRFFCQPPSPSVPLSQRCPLFFLFFCDACRVFFFSRRAPSGETRSPCMRGGATRWGGDGANSREQENTTHVSVVVVVVHVVVGFLRRLRGRRRSTHRRSENFWNSSAKRGDRQFPFHESRHWVFCFFSLLFFETFTHTQCTRRPSSQRPARANADTRTHAHTTHTTHERALA